MTAQFVTTADDVLLTALDPTEAAGEHIAAAALRESPVGRVGLELEFHLVGLRDPLRRPSWSEVQALAHELPPMPSGSPVTVEPGGQLELSTPPATGVAASVAALQADREVLKAALAGLGYGTAPLGTDPARPVRRVNPSSRYAAMEQHFAALGCPAPGRAMMSATAALQVNLDAGPASGWAQRLRLVRDLGPVLVAMSACSPLLAGTSSGWRSMRQQIWHDLAHVVGVVGVDGGAAEPLRADDPAAGWAAYALAAPVMLVRDPVSGLARPMTQRVPLSAWLAGSAPIERPPLLADVDYHLTTLFPPVRPRGYLEIRCLDAVPDRWWPALAAVVATLVDDPVAAGLAADACASVRDAWRAAAQDGLADRGVSAAARRCLDAAAAHCPPELAADVQELAELVDGGRTPGDELRESVERLGPVAALVEAARA
jgi:glutamate--cysteine ligase